MSLYQKDKLRYRGGHMPVYQILMRLLQRPNVFPIKICLKILYRVISRFYNVEISYRMKIGEGLYIGHPYCITINPNAVIGKNVNIHRGVLIGQENRGRRKGTPIIGDKVWIGINSAIVGNITIGNDVLIAPNSFVNCNIPSHSIVFGNPCIIKHCDSATDGYINHIV